MMKAYPYYYLTDGITYVVFSKTQKEADLKILEKIRKLCGYDPQNVANMVRLTCAEKPMAYKKGKIKVSEGKFEPVE